MPETILRASIDLFREVELADSYACTGNPQARERKLGIGPLSSRVFLRSSTLRLSLKL